MSAEIPMPVMKKESTPRKNRNSSRPLLLLLVLFFITLLVVLFFRSSISKISEIEISGNELVSTAQIEEVMGIKVGDHFFGFRKATVSERIRAIPSIGAVQINKKFPGHVSVEVTEHDRIGFRLAKDGAQEVVLADGTVVPVTGQAVPFDRPLLTGWEGHPLLTSLSEALHVVPLPLLSDISEIVPDPSSAYEDKIKLYTRSNFEVSTRIIYLSEKLADLGYIVSYLKENESSSCVRIHLMDVNWTDPVDKVCEEEQ